MNPELNNLLYVKINNYEKFEQKKIHICISILLVYFKNYLFI